MEFKKIPGQPTAPQPYVDPETQMRQSIRLMAKRMLHGARGVIFITGSLLLVIGVVELLYLPEATGLHAQYWEFFSDRFSGGRLQSLEWLTFADILIAIFTLFCGWLVLRMPLVATVLPVLFLTVKILCSIGISLSAGGMPNIPVTIIQAVLVALGLHSISEARAYSREVALSREYFRSTAILRQRESRR